MRTVIQEWNDEQARTILLNCRKAIPADGCFCWLNTAYRFDDERPAAPDQARTAAHDDTGLFFGCPNVDAAYQDLLGKGVQVKAPVITGYGMKQMYLRDPDGYTLCFQWSAKA